MRSKPIVLILALIIATIANAYEPPVEEGKKIFTTRCASCHNVNKVVTGPALAGVDQRRSMDWIISFVSSSQSMIKKGDKDAVALFQKFNKIPMPDHADLTPDNIKNIVEYIKTEATASESKTPFAKPTTNRPAYLPFSISREPWLFTGLLASVLLLIAVMFFAVKVQGMVRER